MEVWKPKRDLQKAEEVKGKDKRTSSEIENSVKTTTVMPEAIIKPEPLEVKNPAELGELSTSADLRTWRSASLKKRFQKATIMLSRMKEDQRMSGLTSISSMSEKEDAAWNLSKCISKMAEFKSLRTWPIGVSGAMCGLILWDENASNYAPLLAEFGWERFAHRARKEMGIGAILYFQ